jgi:ribonuclease HII
MKPHFREENKLLKNGYKLVAGVDEVGRGALAGPIVGAAVILSQKSKIKGINDSKKLKPMQREELFVKITEKAVAWSVSLIDNKFIDKKGITKANYEVLKKAIKKLKIKPEYLLIDAVKIKCGNIPSKSVIKGDEKIRSIAAASIVAKVFRDSLMRDYHRIFPKYFFNLHKGYGTKKHFAAIKKHGPSPLHRRSFLKNEK